MSQSAQEKLKALKPQLVQAKSTTWVWDLAALIGLFAIVYFFKLGSYPLYTPDEGRYSEVAREMLVTGDFITPRLNGVVFLDKPIMYYWLQASAMKLFGLTEWALRFWPVIAGLWGIAVMYISGRLLFSRRTGILSALILGTCVLYYGAAHYANLDLEVAVLVSTTLLAFLLGLKSTSPAQSRLWIYSAYLFAGLAVLTKGLIGIAFPALIVGSWGLIQKKWGEIKKLRLFSGALITLSIVLPWYILAQQANHEFFHFFFIVQQISRFLSTNDFNNQVAWWFYIPIVLAGFLPWTLFIPSMLVNNIKKLSQSRTQHDNNLFLVLWFALIFTFFSIPHSKTIGYILPVFPALALLVGQYIDDRWEAWMASSKRLLLSLWILSFGFFAIICFCATSIRAVEIPSELIPLLKLAGFNFSIALLVLSYFFIQKNFPRMLTTAVLSTFVFFSILVTSAGIINSNTTKPLAMQLKPTLHPQDEIVTFYKYFQDLPLYLERRITIVADWDDPGIEHNDNWLRELWYGKSFQDTQAWLINENTFWKRWNGSQRMYVLTNLKYYEALKSKAGTRFYLVNQHNETILVTNIPL